MARTKIPYFPFYPKDYLSDTAVRGLNAEQRGVLVELFCWMAVSPVYGALYEAEIPIPKEQIITDVILPGIAEPKTRDRAAGILEMLMFKRLIRKGLNGAFYNKRLLFYLTPKEKFELKGAAMTEFMTQIRKIVPPDDIPEYFQKASAERRLVHTTTPNTNGDRPPRTEKQKILDAEIEEAQKTYRAVFGKEIRADQVGLLTYGRGGSGKNCWQSIPVLVAFWRSCRGQKIDDPLAWSLSCAQNPQTVARFEKAAFNEPATTRGGDIEQLF